MDPRSKAWRESAESLRQNLRSQEKEDIRRRVNEMKATRMEGGNWWREWSGSLAAVLGILAGGTTLITKVSAAGSGTLVNFSCPFFSLAIAKASVSVTGIATAAGSAVLVGAGVAAAIYFIPWDKFFEWLGRVVSWLADGFATIWDMFKSWLVNQGSDAPRYSDSRPMTF